MPRESPAKTFRGTPYTVAEIQVAYDGGMHGGTLVRTYRPKLRGPTEQPSQQTNGNTSEKQNKKCISEELIHGHSTRQPQKSAIIQFKRCSSRGYFRQCKYASTWKVVSIRQIDSYMKMGTSHNSIDSLTNGFAATVKKHPDIGYLIGVCTCKLILVTYGIIHI